MTQTRWHWRKPWRRTLPSRDSIQMRLEGLITVVTLLVLVFCSVSVIYFISLTESATWRDRQEDAAGAAAVPLAILLEHSRASLRYVADLDPRYLAAYPTVLRDVIGPHPELLETVRLDVNGRVLDNTYRDRALLANLFTIPLSEWFVRAKAGEDYLGAIQISANNMPYLTLAVPTSDGGVVAARLNVETIWQRMTQIHFGEGGRAYLVNRSGQVVAHRDPAVMLAYTTLAGRPEFEGALVSPTGRWTGEYVNFEGVPVVGLTVPIGDTPWLLISEMPQAEVYATSRAAANILVGSILFAMLVVTWLSRRILRAAVLEPMERLRAGAVRFGAGDLDFRIGLRTQNEIGVVATALDEMAGHLRDREREVATQTAALETEIAERKQVEQALRQSETHYRAIVEDQTELVCRFLPNGTLTFVNDAYCRYFGKRRHELEGHTFMLLIPPEDQALVAQQFGSLSPANPVTTYEHRVILADEEMRWMQWTDRLITDTHGVPIEYQSVGRDTTERRLAEDEIRRLNADLERRVAERTEQLAVANVGLQNEVVERRRAEATLRAGQERLRLALVAARAGAYEWFKPTNRIYWSDENYVVMGLQPGSVEPSYASWLLRVHPDDRAHAGRCASAAAERNEDLDIEFRVVWPDGTIRWISDIGKTVFDEAGQPLGMFGVQLDITERKQAEDRIRESLREKEVLLKEIHHRVKNNLQIISSLLNLQASASEDAAVSAQFLDSQSRIRSMALIHERLYRSQDLSHVEFGGYVRELAAYLAQTYRAQGQGVDLKVVTENVELDIDTAIPCGLIVNELVSNALKHAFPDGRRGHVSVELRTGSDDATLQLVIADDGVGIPAESDIWALPSLGLQLVKSLTRQIAGEITFERAGGCRFCVAFPRQRRRDYPA